ncbi:hypothetical protein LWI29_035938 [Acer saccharum]|uniref:UBA domain-containing protein n=1 Tax=Acer saccharum TaxID=4024 RepID=A0AA39SWK5_ACESA|nr:hypothetical protein LWI29_035938 [Acer saccharum]
MSIQSIETGIYLFPKEMSPASKSKSKDKKASKETPKTPSKSAGPANAGSNVPASAYNPLLGTFHTLDAVPTSSTSVLHINGRFRNIDETDEHLGGSPGTGVEYDSVSNNGSWSGESEDQKDKTSNQPARLETIPGADNDKREKIRQKNERKHQRQKERRAQELHERCNGYLMSRKLEALAQQLVAMGFSHERATMALILNEGKVEESVAWLFEGGEDADQHKDSNIGGGNLKIDISEELARIADMEIRYKCTKQEVERAIVGAEGNLENAAETLRVMKQEPTSAPPKPEETGDPPTGGDGKLSVTVGHNSAVRLQLQLKSNPPATIQRRDDKDFNYTKAAVTVGGSSQSGSKSVAPLKRVEPKLEWAKPQKTVVVPAEKRWSSAGSNSSVSYSLASPLQASPPPSKTEARYIAVGSEIKNLQPAVREPVIMMQRPQSVITKQVPATSISSSPPRTATSWYPSNNVEIMKSNGFMTHIPSNSFCNNNMSSNQMYQQFHYQQQQQQQHQQQQQQHFIPSSSQQVESPGSSRGNASWRRVGAAPPIAAASSLGLFSGLGSTGSSGASSPVDWSTAGSMSQFDYTNIDWSLDRGLTTSPRPGGLWIGPTSVKNSVVYDSNTNGVGSNIPTMRATGTNGNSVPIPVPVLKEGDSSAGGSHEWTSPFEGKDLFSLPRQFVSSPSL